MPLSSALMSGEEAIRILDDDGLVRSKDAIRKQKAAVAVMMGEKAGKKQITRSPGFWLFYVCTGAVACLAIVLHLKGWI